MLLKVDCLIEFGVLGPVLRGDTSGKSFNCRETPPGSFRVLHYSEKIVSFITQVPEL